MSDETQKRIFLGVPGYDGRLTVHAGRAMWWAMREPDPMLVKYQNGSLLACNFNLLWTMALNCCQRGIPINRFAMLHDDIGPEDFWLDSLLAELDARDLDVLGVVSPLKDWEGMTSIALHNPGDNWRPKCRLTLDEIFRLPETFTSEDVGYPLLFNTGCWVCRFDPSWASKVYFTVNDRIVWNCNSHRYEAQVESEDWFFSRLCHEQGLKIGVTRKVKLVHRGQAEFPNTYPWGTKGFDTNLLQKSLVPGSEEPEKFRFPHDVAGWLDYDEGRELSRLARGKRVLEIGSFCGRSTICLAQTAKSVVAVDYFDGRGTPEARDTRGEFLHNLRRYKVHEVVEPADPEAIPERKYDFIFIDGAHDEDSVRADIEKSLPLLAEGGLLAFHDYDNHNYDPGVKVAVDEFLGRGATLVSTHQSLAVVRPPSLVSLEV
jgi:hypothetical protein